MFFYEGCTCAACGKPLTSTDDIVACPKCGAPHHRDCWMKEGQCHFAADHDTDRQWKRPDNTTPPPAHTDVPTGKVCPNCHHSNTEHAEFCSKCGRELPFTEWRSTTPPPNQGQTPPRTGHPYGNPPPYGQGNYPPPGGYGEYAPFHMPTYDPFGGVPHNETIEDTPAEDLVTFVGTNSAYYLPRFYRLSKSRSKVSWNWAAFLFAPYWLFYRKNFLSGILSLLFFVAKTVMEGLILYGVLAPQIADATGAITYDALFNALTGSYSIYAGILILLSLLDGLIHLLFGLFGNYVYMNTAINRIKKLSALPGNNYKQELLTAGGASFMLGAVAYSILTFANFLISYFAYF